MTIVANNVSLTIVLCAVVCLCPISRALAGQPILPIPSQERPIDIVKSYLQAHQARDPRAAYRHISAIDRSVRDEKTYLRSQESFDGFALELARKLAAEMEVWVIDQETSSTKARFEVGYRVPAGDEMAPQLFAWNPVKLNALSANEQRRLLETFDSVKNRGKITTIEGRETFDLVQEKGRWKIFLDWSSRTRVVFKALAPRSGELEVRFLRNDFLVKADDPFQADFIVRNQTNRSTVVSLNHRFEPLRMAENVDMIACGSLAPFRLAPQAVQGMASHYLLRAATPKQAQLSIIYDFNTQPAAVERKKSP